MTDDDNPFGEPKLPPGLIDYGKAEGLICKVCGNGMKLCECKKERAENGVIRAANGQLLPGHPGLPGCGRPAGSMDFMSICRRKAREQGHDLDVVVYAVVRALFRSSLRGDTAAAGKLLDRLCGLQEKGSAVAIQINNEGMSHDGPPVPTGASLGSFIAKLGEVAKRQGLLEPDDDEVD